LIDHFVDLSSVRGRAPEGKQVYSVCHMEEEPTDALDPLTVPVPGIEGTGWRLALRTPSIDPDYGGGPITLRDFMAMVYVRGA
jgi:hypothetical protein